MICSECREDAFERQEGDYRYRESGLGNVYLRNIEWDKCANCGIEEAWIPKMGQLHQCIGWRLVCKEKKLSGPEIRFLRSILGTSQVDFAELLGVGQSTLSRLESGGRKVTEGVDRLIRLTYLVEQEDEYTSNWHQLLHKFLRKLTLLKKAAHKPDGMIIDVTKCSPAAEANRFLELATG